MLMTKMKRLSVLALASLSLVACASQSQSTKEDTVKLGIIQLVEHEDLDNTREGFLQALADAGLTEGENLTINLQNAQGDQSKLQTMIEQFSGKTDLNLAIATPSAQGLAGIDEETPAVFAAVTDPLGAGLVDSLDEPGGLMTGASNAQDIDRQIAILLEVLPEAKTVGTLYNSSEANAEVQVQRATEALEKRGIKVVAKPVSSTNDVQEAAQALAKQVDAIYLPTDSLLGSTMPTIGEVMRQTKTPAIGSSRGFLDAVLFTTGVDYIQVGRQAGELAVKILDGEDPGKLAVTFPEKTTIEVNEEMAELLGIDPESIKALED